MRLTITTILIALLITDLLPAQQPGADSPIKQEIAGLPSNSLVEVRMIGGDRRRGHIVKRTDIGFTLEEQKAARSQTIAYDQVLSVSQVRAGHAHKKWIIVGIALGAVAVVVIVFVVIAKTKGPFALPG